MTSESLMKKKALRRKKSRARSSSRRRFGQHAGRDITKWEKKLEQVMKKRAEWEKKIKLAQTKMNVWTKEMLRIRDKIGELRLALMQRPPEELSDAELSNTLSALRKEGD